MGEHEESMGSTANLRPRRPSTFSLRKLLVVVAITGTGCALLRLWDFETPNPGLTILLIGLLLALWFRATKCKSEPFWPAWLFVIGIVFFAALMPPGPRSRESPRNGQCLNNLRQIALALHAYHEKYGHFPPAYVADANGKPLYSWRVLILPFLGQTKLAESIRMDEAWDGPDNARLTRTSIPRFECPSDPAFPTMSGGTSYLAVVGPNTAWPGTTPRRFSEIAEPSQTILVVEVENSGVHWAEPRDLYIGQMPMEINPKRGQGLSSAHTRCANAVFVDGSTHSLPDSITPQTLANLFDTGEKDTAALDRGY